MAAYVGHTKETLRAKTSTKNSNFPNGINGDTEVCFMSQLLENEAIRSISVE